MSSKARRPVQLWLRGAQQLYVGFDPLPGEENNQNNGWSVW